MNNSTYLQKERERLNKFTKKELIEIILALEAKEKDVL